MAREELVSSHAVGGQCARCARPVDALVCILGTAPTHCVECASSVAELALYAWFDRFQDAGVPEALLGGACMGIVLATVGHGATTRAEFLRRAEQAWDETAPLAKAVDGTTAVHSTKAN